MIETRTTRRSVLQSIGVDVVDVRAKHCVALLFDAMEQRLQPAHVRLNVRVEEDDHVTDGLASAEVFRTDQAESFGCAQNAHKFAQVLLAIFLERLAELGQSRPIVDQNDLFEQVKRRAVHHAIDAAQHGRPAFVVEREDDTYRGQVDIIDHRFATVNFATFDLKLACLVSKQNEPNDDYILRVPRVGYGAPQ